MSKAFTISAFAPVSHLALSEKQYETASGRGMKGISNE